VGNIQEEKRETLEIPAKREPRLASAERVGEPRERDQSSPKMRWT